MAEGASHSSDSGDRDPNGSGSAETSATPAGAKAASQDEHIHLKGERAGERIGPYTLLQRIGEGGFGTVWLAERREPIVQRVALKVIKAGMDTKAVVARFEQERQALAVMDHPYIAKVFDAGATPTGRPYFVMEHVPGEPITDYADRHSLSVRQRLEIFAQVCDAVQHAHLKGIIHRDIKPSNILVSVRDGKPAPKVIDFGVAKAITHTLTEKTIFTEQGHLIGTPEYMSPEQAEMGATDIDTRTDVYSLGVVLYELLSGLLPFDSRALRGVGYAAICKVLREQDPPKPSTRLSTADAGSGADIAKHRKVDRKDLALELRRELDWIPLKALRKDRVERYQSPSDLARDVRNYLDGKPLEAGPESAAYRARKYVRRNKGPVVAAAAVFFALVLGLAGTLWQAESARREARRADERAVAAAKAEGEARAAEAEQRRLAESEAEARKTADAKTVEAVAAAETIERNAYVANIQMAGAAMEMRLFDRVRQRLDACPERLRGWEWDWLNATADSSLVVLKGHTDSVTFAAFSPDGTRIVTASGDKTARVSDAVTGARLAGFSEHGDRLTSGAFCDDGTRVVTGSVDGTARVWDSTTGASLAKLIGHSDTVSSAAFNTDGTRIITTSIDGTARVWNAADGALLVELIGHSAAVVSGGFSPDGKRIVTASFDNTARVWYAETGKSLLELKGHDGLVHSAVFSPDGTRIVTTSFDGTARVWHAETGTSLLELKGHNSLFNSAVFSPDGARILTASLDKTARIWDAINGRSVADLHGHTESVNSAVFSPDGKRIVTSSDDNTARVWDAVTGAMLAELRGHTSMVYSASFSPNGLRIITASADTTARVWDAEPSDSLVELKGHDGTVNSAAFNLDGTRIVTSSDDGTARLWDAGSGVALVTLFGHEGVVSAAEFSPESTTIVTASDDKTARVWDAATGTMIAVLKGHHAEVTSARFCADGRHVFTQSDDKTGRVWDAATGESVIGLGDCDWSVRGAGFSPDGLRVVNVSDGFGPSAVNVEKVVDTRVSTFAVARVWHVATRSLVAELKGHALFINSCAFSPDGTRIVTASADGTARIWDSVPYRERFKELQARGLRK